MRVKLALISDFYDHSLVGLFASVIIRHEIKFYCESKFEFDTSSTSRQPIRCIIFFGMVVLLPSLEFPNNVLRWEIMAIDAAKSVVKLSASEERSRVLNTWTVKACCVACFGYVAIATNSSQNL